METGDGTGSAASQRAARLSGRGPRVVADGAIGRQDQVVEPPLGIEYRTPAAARLWPTTDRPPIRAAVGGRDREEARKECLGVKR